MVINESYNLQKFQKKDQGLFLVILAKDAYDSLIETLEIQINLYLMNKINAGRQEVENGNVEKIVTLDDSDNWREEL